MLFLWEGNLRKEGQLSKGILSFSKDYIKAEPKEITRQFLFKHCFLDRAGKNFVFYSCAILVDMIKILLGIAVFIVILISVFSVSALGKPIGPGLGYHNDFAWFDNNGSFIGIQDAPQPSRSYPSQE